MLVKPSIMSVRVDSTIMKGLRTKRLSYKNLFCQ